VVPIDPAHAAARGAARASQVLDRGTKPLPRYAPQVLGRGAQPVARGAARCASQVLCCNAQAVARGAATLTQQEKNKSANVQRNRVNITGCICAVVKYLSRRCTFGEIESLTSAPRRR
jgi:hypothetical protein